jgi:hypothetical protein
MPGEMAELSHGDPTKARVLKHLDQLVAGGFAELHMLSNGESQLRFHTGETFLLKETVIVRVR